MAHVQGGEREVRTHRVPALEGPIAWAKRERGAVRVGQGRSGLTYKLERGRVWKVLVLASGRREVEVGSAKLQDHALALAAMWEQAVLSGRLDID